jgi:flagellar protein FlgJ
VPAAAAAGAPTGSASVSQTQADFVRVHQQAADAAQAQTGIPAAFMVAQAAHESGWGRREIRNTDGSNSFNVFGIKAGSGWKGAVATVATTEYSGGQAHAQTAKFRAYGSYQEAFQDYAKMMKGNARYAQVVADSSTAQGFAQGLQRAGYATDPAYAAKLTRVINTTLRVQRASDLRTTIQEARA